MSRIGNRVLTIPAGVEVNVDGNKVTVKGPKGTLEFNYRNDNVDVKVEGSEIHVSRKSETKVAKQLHGTTNSVINNMLKGVSEGFKKELEINGVGYRFQVQGSKLIITAGYSHPVNVKIPAGITLESPSNTELVVKGIDKQAVGQFAAEVRSIREPEPYKGKGIRYTDEHIIRKEGKKAA